MKEAGEPATAAMRRTWEHTRAATVAGAHAWRNGNVLAERATPVAISDGTDRVRV